MSDHLRSIPYGRQSIDDEDVAAVVRALRSDWLTQGPEIEAFEKRVAELCQVRYAVAVSNATAALHIACMAADLGPGDLLWTSPNTFVASANCGRYCGAEVDFVDIDPRSYNLCATELEKKLDSVAKKPKVVIPVHFAGQSCEMERIHELKKKHGFTVIEDASHAIGGSYRGKPIGACEFSDMAVFSFHPVKIITTGEGGMVLTQREDLYKRLVRLRTHGITKDPTQMVDPSHGPWYMQQLELGYNYRLTDLQAALGSSQLSKMRGWIERRREIARVYDEAFADLELTRPWQHPGGQSAYHLYPVHVGNKERRLKIFNQLRAAGLGVMVHYIPVHTQPDYRRLGFREEQYPNAVRYYEGAISLPMYAALSDEDQKYVIRSVREALRS